MNYDEAVDTLSKLQGLPVAIDSQVTNPAEFYRPEGLRFTKTGVLRYQRPDRPTDRPVDEAAWFADRKRWQEAGKHAFRAEPHEGGLFLDRDTFQAAFWDEDALVIERGAFRYRVVPLQRADGRDADGRGDLWKEIKMTVEATSGDAERQQQYSTTVGDFLSEPARAERLFASPQHRRTSEALIELYRDRGLLPKGRDLSLRCCCPHRDECWDGAPPPRDARNSGVAIPWIGCHYFDTRVAVLGMNFDNFGGLAGHYWVCEDHIRSMEAGKPGKDGRYFARGAMKYLRAVLASMDLQGVPSDGDSVSNEDLAPLWERCAYLQTIKCSPGTERSNPTEAMIANCPEFLLKEELEILKPTVIVLFGRGHLRDVVRPWLVPEEGYGHEEGPNLERNAALLDGEPVTLLSLNHPATPNRRSVEASLNQLVESLGTMPLR